MKQLTFQEINLPTGRSFSVDDIKMSSANMAATLRRWHQRSAQRRRLAGLLNRLLDDMGITGERRFEEISKPFWRA